METIEKLKNAYFLSIHKKGIMIQFLVGSVPISKVSNNLIEPLYDNGLSSSIIEQGHILIVKSYVYYPETNEAISIQENPKGVELIAHIPLPIHKGGDMLFFLKKDVSIDELDKFFLLEDVTWKISPEECDCPLKIINVFNEEDANLIKSSAQYIKEHKILEGVVFVEIPYNEKVNLNIEKLREQIIFNAFIPFFDPPDIDVSDSVKELKLETIVRISPTFIMNSFSFYNKRKSTLVPMTKDNITSLLDLSILSLGIYFIFSWLTKSIHSHSFIVTSGTILFIVAGILGFLVGTVGRTLYPRVFRKSFLLLLFLMVIETFILGKLVNIKIDPWILLGVLGVTIPVSILSTSVYDLVITDSEKAWRFYQEVARPSALLLMLPFIIMGIRYNISLKQWGVLIVVSFIAIVADYAIINLPVLLGEKK